MLHAAKHNKEFQQIGSRDCFWPYISSMYAYKLKESWSFRTPLKNFFLLNLICFYESFF